MSCVGQHFRPLQACGRRRYAHGMQLTDDDIKDFIDAWRSDFGETLSADAARSEALRLLDFFAWLVEELASRGKGAVEIQTHKATRT